MATNLLRRLRKPVSPNLPLADETYSRYYQDQLNSILRLFFNQLSTIIASLIGTRGGKYLEFPYAAIQRTTDVLFTANTIKEITFDQNDFLSGCANDGTNGIAVEQDGIYNYQFSLQFANTATQIHTAWVWLRINNVDVAGTASKFDVPNKHGSSDGYLIATCNFYVELQEGDYVSLYAAVDQAYSPTVPSTGIYVEAYAAQTSPFAHPAIPAAVATLSFVSALPA